MVKSMGAEKVLVLLPESRNSHYSHFPCCKTDATLDQHSTFNTPGQQQLCSVSYKHYYSQLLSAPQNKNKNRIVSHLDY